MSNATFRGCPPDNARKRILFVLLLACAGLAQGADLTKDGSAVYAYGTWDHPATGYWYAATGDWTCKSNNVAIADTFPQAGWIVDCGNWNQSNCGIVLGAGEQTPQLRGLRIGYGNGGQTYTMFLQPGSLARIRAVNGNSNYEGLRLGDYYNAYGKLYLDNATLVCNYTLIGNKAATGTAKPGRGYVYAGNDSVITNNYISVGGPAEGTFVLDHSRYEGDQNYAINVGGDGTGRDYRSTLTVRNQSYCTAGGLMPKGTADVLFDQSQYVEGAHNWSASDCTVRLSGDIDQTNTVKVVDSSFSVYKTAYDTSASGSYWARWCKIRFQSKGYSEFVQENAAVTNCGVWFWPVQNADNVYPLKPPRYVITGGSLYVHNISNNGDSVLGHPNGDCACGFAAATNAPNSGTISLVDAPEVSYPRVCTNLLLSGMGQDANARTFGVTEYRPHFEFVLTKKGLRPMEIREQTDVLGMYSVIPQGGLQVVQTNRFALIRHKTASQTLTTLDEPQFRAPNADLWTTGGFADAPCEWGVTVKPAAEITSGADLGAGIASGCIPVSWRWRDDCARATVRLEMSPRAKTLAEIAGDLTAAGYPATVANTDEVIVDLKASGMLKRGRGNRILFDFTEPPDAVQMRDNLLTTNAVVLKATVECTPNGLVVLIK